MGIPFDPFARPSLTDTVADRILRLVDSAQFVVGDRLPPIAEMVQMFGVSPNTLRSALEKLKSAGAIEVRPGLDMYVNETLGPMLKSDSLVIESDTKKLLLDLVEALEPVEVPAAELAAVHATEHSLDRMEACLSEAATSRDDEARSRGDARFHSAIAEASGNGVLFDLQRSLAMLFQREQLAIHRCFGFWGCDHAEHLALLDAIRCREPALAAARMRSHLDGIRRSIERWDGSWTPPGPSTY